MSINKKILFTVAFMLMAAFAIAATAEETKSNLGDNRLIYKVKYINGNNLARLLDEFVNKSEGMRVEFIEGLNTIAITAPKETHQILMALIEKFDKEPTKVELNIYLVLRSPKDSAEFKSIEKEANIDNDFHEKLDTLNSLNSGFRYYGLGKLYLPLSSGKKIYDSRWMIMLKIGTLFKFEIITKSITFIDQTIQLEDFTVLLIDDSGKTDLLMKHSFDIDTTSMDKLTLSGTQNILGMSAPESLEMVFWPSVIKK
jgi:hypothetical protein